MNKNNYAVIMAGGIGSRFWPMSKQSRPKQFIDILGIGETLIQQTFRRLGKICPNENILIVTNKNYKTLCLEQLPNVKKENEEILSRQFNARGNLENQDNFVNRVRIEEKK